MWVRVCCRGVSQGVCLAKSVSTHCGRGKHCLAGSGGCNKYIWTALPLKLYSVVSMQGLGEGSGVEFSLGNHSDETLKGVLGH